VKALEELRRLGYLVSVEEEGRLHFHWQGEGQPPAGRVKPLLEQVRRQKKEVVAALAAEGAQVPPDGAQGSFTAPPPLWPEQPPRDGGRRALVLRMGQLLGWPTLPTGSGDAIGPGMAAWAEFCHLSTDDQIAKALAVLEALQKDLPPPPPVPTDGAAEKLSSRVPDPGEAGGSEDGGAGRARTSSPGGR